MIEADGDDGTLPHVVDALERAARGDGLVELASATDPAANEALWAARKALSPALRTIAAGKINEDVVVPVSRLPALVAGIRSEEHTSELQSLMRISYAVFCLKKKTNQQ